MTMNWPKEWKEGNLNDLCELRQDVCLPSNSETNNYVGLEHIAPGRFTIRSYGKPEQVVSAKNRFSTSDVLYGKLRPYLDKAVVPDRKGICSTDILVFSPKNETPSYFLAGLLHTDRFIQYAAQTTHGVNHPRTSWTVLKDFEIGIPKIPEQRKIAAMLFRIQKAIELQESIIDRTRELKNSAMQFVFTHGLRGEKTKETEIGMMPDSWKIQPFEQFATLRRGFDLPVQDRIPGHVPIVGSNGIVGYHNQAKINGPGVVTGRSGSIGLSYYIDRDYWPLNTGLYVADFHNNHPLFIHYYFNVFDFEKYSAGVSVPTLNRNLVHSVLIGVPRVEEQKEIAQFLSVVDRKLDLHIVKKSVFQNLFKTMLNKLMSGEIRVKDLEINVEVKHA